MSFLSNLFGPPLPCLTVQALNEQLNNAKGPFVIDVRQPEEYRNGHIIGAKLIPLGELQKRLSELPKDKEIVCVCASGNRSSLATKMLMKAGYNVLNMDGGMFKWQRSGLPIKKDNAR